MKSTRLHNIFQGGYTLVEVVVVVAIVGILTAVIAVNVVDSGKKSRDAKRQADLRTLQTAIELYKNKYGRYPAQCATSGASADGWSGQQGTNYACSGNDTQYIVGHVDVSDFDGDGDITERFSFAPEFIPVLPKDPKLNGAASGYAYRTNAAGTVYKLMARSTVESETVTYEHKFSSCDINPLNNAVSNIQLGGWCITGVAFAGNNRPDQCMQDNVIFQKSYGLWGGFEKLLMVGTDPQNPLTSLSNNNKYFAVSNTTNVICR